LLWLNHQYIMNSDPAHVARHLSWHIGQLGIDPSEGPALVDVVKAQRERSQTLVEMARASAFFYREFDEYDEKAVKKNFSAEAGEVLAALHDRFAEVEDWQKEPLHQVIVDLAEAKALGMGKVAQPLRVAVTGTAVSPAIDVTLALLGKDKTLARIRKAIEMIKNLN
jgi:glutamyl-tRNA synthetase